MLNDLNQQYIDFETGVLTKDQLAKSIIETIYIEPHRFGLANMESDHKNEFMIFLLVRIQDYITRYSKSISTFSTYICGTIFNLRKSWFREYYHKVAHTKSVQYFYESEENYEIAEEEPEYTYTKKYNQLSKKDIIIILVLALKSFYYLEKHHIMYISQITNIPVNTIYELIHKITLTADKKCQKHTEEFNKLNKSYIKKHRFRIELMHIDSSSILAHHLEKYHQFYTNKWKDCLKRYNSAPPLKPSNAHIAKVLQIKEFQVYQIIKECKERNSKNLPLINWK